MTTVRIRGIYSTALTQLLSSEYDIVQASEPIQARFDEAFPDVPATVEIETSDDRQGVSVSGEREAVESVTSLLRFGVDTLTWSDPTPAGAVFNGYVTETLSGGAVIDLSIEDRCSEEENTNEREGYLPYSNAEDYVDDNDSVRVQVDKAVPPWSDDRPVLQTGTVVSNGFGKLVRGGTENGSGGGVGTSIDFVDVLSSEPRDGWELRWNDRATDASFDALGNALTDLNERAESVDSVLQSDSDDCSKLTTQATTWVWFGRESRFALDEQRRSVTSTMTGHHRIKAGTQSASGAVDFAETVCEPGANQSFPFDVTARQFGPQEGDRIAIGHGKPDGRYIVLGRGEVTDFDPEGTITLERQMSPGGTYDALRIERQSGDVAITKLKEGRWWYPTVYQGSDGERRGTYVNICTPVELFPDVARYVDLHVDVVKHADGTTERVDDNELDSAVERGEVPKSLAEKARSVATAIERVL
jgi:hypothetical protein